MFRLFLWFTGKNLVFLLQLPTGLPKITIQVCQQKNCWDPPTDFFFNNIQHFSSQLSYCLKIIRQYFNGLGFLKVENQLPVSILCLFLLCNAWVHNVFILVIYCSGTHA